MAERADDEVDYSDNAGGEDNSVGRFMALSDGVFAIAMTLLALDLKVPEVARDAGHDAVRHALAHQWPSYQSYLISFYVVGVYWMRHHRLMRRLTSVNRHLMRDNILFLLFVSALPFPASLIGQYGTTDPIALAVYGGVNAAATIMLIRLQHDVRRDQLAPDLGVYRYLRADSIGNLIVFLICIPAGYVVGAKHAPYVLLLLFVSGNIVRWKFRNERTH